MDEPFGTPPRLHECPVPPCMGTYILPCYTRESRRVREVSGARFVLYKPLGTPISYIRGLCPPGWVPKGTYIRPCYTRESRRVRGVRGTGFVLH